MNVNDLKVFQAVAAHGSFTKAAEAMFTVQSNVTARIKALEDEFGTQLLARTSRKVTLTDAGEKLIQYSKQITQLVEEARLAVSAQDQVVGHLKIGCIETSLALRIPGVINLFSEQYPDVALEFVSGNSPGLIQDVLRHKLDAAFVSTPIDFPELEQCFVKKDKLVIVSGVNTTLKAILAEKTVRTVVFDQGCSYRERLESWFNAKGISRYRCTVVNTMEGIINFVEAGVGITVLPEELIDKFYGKRKLQKFPLGRDLNVMSTVLVFRKRATQSRALQAFADTFKD